MSEIEALVNISAVLLMMFVMGVQGYIFGNLFTGKLFEYYDIHTIKGLTNTSLAEQGYCSSSESCEKVYFEMINQAKKWERG